MQHFYDKATKELRNYVKQTWNNDDRFPRLLLRLSPIRSLQSDLVEELFFGALIGQVHIDSIIPFILTMDQTNYNGIARILKIIISFPYFFFKFKIGEADQAEECLTPEISI